MLAALPDRQAAVGRLAIASAAAGFLLLSLAPFWVSTVRTVVGYGSLRIIGGAGAWAGYYVPFLALAAAALALAGLVALALAVRRAPRRSSEAWLYGGAGTIALASMVGAFLAGPGGAQWFNNGSFIVRPGPLAFAGLFLAAIPLLIAVRLARAAGSRTARRGAALQRAIGGGVAGVVLLGVLIGLGPVAATAPPAPDSAAAIPDWRSDPNEPYPFTTNVPALEPTILDGVYSRPPTDTYEGERAHCIRCPPYPVDAGRSTLTLDRGRFHVVHVDSPYETRGHYVVSGTRIILLNDPECGAERGVYRWTRDAAGMIELTVIADPCGFDQRAIDLTFHPWQLKQSLTPDRRGYCDPPNEEAAVTGHWPEPDDC
jgi:hypothetical protein